MPTTAAISAGIGAVGSIGGALIGSSAASNASSQQVAEQQAALAQQKQMFGVAQNALNPFIGIGGSAGNTLQSLLTPGSDAAATLSKMPGFAFASQYGNLATTNALAARTGASAGPLAAALSQYNNGLASTQYFNTVNALQNTFGTGASAASALAGNAITSGNSQAQTFGNIGTAQAAGTLGSANALAGGLNGAAGSASNALLYSQLFGNGGGGGGLYTPQQIQNIGNMQASSLTDAQANAYGTAFGL